MFPLTNTGGSWGWWQPGEGGSTFNSTDPNGHTYGGGGYVDDYGYFLAPPPAAPAGPSSGGGTAPASGASGNAASYDWSTGRPRLKNGEAVSNQDVGLDELMASGLWKNMGDPANSPYWQALLQNNPSGFDNLDYLNDPHNMAQELLARSGVDPYDTAYTVDMDDLQKAFGGQGLSSDVTGQIKGGLNERMQSVLAGPDFLDKFEGMLMPLLASFFPVIGPALAGAMGSAQSDESPTIGSTLKGAVKGYVGGEIGQGLFGANAADSSWLNEVDAIPASMNPSDLGQLAGANVGANGTQLANLDPSIAGTTTDVTGGMLTPSDPALGQFTFDSSMDPGDFQTTNFGPDPASATAAAPAQTPSSQPPQKSTVQQLQQIQKYVKLADTVKDLLGAKAQDGPAQADGESDQDYGAELVNYLGLDNQTMADAGLEPGSPEYMQYIEQQADSIIHQVLGDIDVNADDLSAQLRGKSEAEMLQLQRALFVRGALDARMGAGTYADPLSGQMQEVTGSGTFNPNVAAAQRGWAGDINDLAGLRGNDALSKIQGMLSRNRDPFNMQADQDARFEQAKRDDQDEERKRRGMLGL